MAKSVKRKKEMKLERDNDDDDDEDDGGSVGYSGDIINGTAYGANDDSH